MGGCRCSFRQCPVATERNKGMHFFKFPKHKERLQIWLKFSGFSDSSFENVQYKVICSRHFHDHHFMNYKRNRLTPSAIPYLARISEDMALDFENDVDNPALIRLAHPTQSHLIPPKNFADTMCFVEADRKLADDIIRSFGPAPQQGDSQKLKRVYGSKQSPPSTMDAQKAKKLKMAEGNELLDKYSHVISEENEYENQITAIFDETNFSIEEQGFFNEVSRPAANKGNMVKIIDQKLFIGSANEIPKLSNIRIPENKGNVEPIRRFSKEVPKPSNVNVPENSRNVKQTKDEKIIVASAKEVRKPSIIKISEKKLKVEEHIVDQRIITYVEKELNLGKRENSAQSVDYLKSELQSKIQELEETQKNLLELKEKVRVLNRTIKVIESENECLSSEKESIEENNNELEYELVEERVAHDRLKEKHSDLEKENEELKKELISSGKKDDEIKDELVNLKEAYNVLKAENLSLRKINEELKTHYQHQKHSSSQSHHDKQHQLSKVQLFNGIKKYLSQTMVALLRIQLSGSSDRDWKPDEKRLAIDLYFGVGEEAYKFFFNEWLIRLPPLQQVKLWRNQNTILDEEDEI